MRKATYDEIVSLFPEVMKVGAFVGFAGKAEAESLLKHVLMASLNNHNKGRGLFSGSPIIRETHNWSTSGGLQVCIDKQYVIIEKTDDEMRLYLTDVCYRALAKHLGLPCDPAAKSRAMLVAALQLHESLTEIRREHELSNTEMVYLLLEEAFRLQQIKVRMNLRAAQKETVS